MPSWIAPATYVAVPVATVLLLIAHTFHLADVEVDTTTLGLLALLLLAPLAPHVRRLSAGGVEAEIAPREALDLKASAVNLPPSPPGEASLPTDAPTVEELIARDPPLGLAKLRIDLERELGKLYHREVSDGRHARPLGLGQMTRDLASRGVLPPAVESPLRDVLALANRAVHGERVQPEVAEDIAYVGLRVLDAIESINEADDVGNGAPRHGFDPAH